MDKAARAYLSEIGRRGGKKSRRRLGRADAQQMVRVREARRAYRDFHTTCFWSFDPDYVVGVDDIKWVAERLMTYGGRAGWGRGSNLCRERILKLAWRD
jgi:hypothetical protein